MAHVLKANLRINFLAFVACKVGLWDLREVFVK